MLTKVHLLWHIYEVDGVEGVKLCGVYTTPEKAEAARLRLLDKPGFRDWPDAFEIAATVLDRDEWTEGFVSWDGA